MDIDLTARMGTKEEFYELFHEGDEKKLFDGRPLIFYAVANKVLDTRYEICDFLLDRNVDVTRLNNESQSILHIVLGQVSYDIPKLTSLCKRLIENGADINILDKRKTVALKSILYMKNTDEELAPLYDLWFSQPYVELTVKDKWGLTPIDFAKKDPNRDQIVKRMISYVEERQN